MINQIESGRCKPSYETARKIFEILSSLEGQSSMKAGDICNRNLISAQKHETLHAVINKMRSNSISQVPVFDGSRVVGPTTREPSNTGTWLIELLLILLITAWRVSCFCAEIKLRLHISPAFIDD